MLRAGADDSLLRRCRNRETALYFPAMTKSELVAQLRVHLISQGASPREVFHLRDNAVIDEVVGRCGWCGGPSHVQGERLEQLISISLDEKHFRAQWNDHNNVACPTLKGSS